MSKLTSGIAPADPFTANSENKVSPPIHLPKSVWLEVRTRSHLVLNNYRLSSALRMSSGLWVCESRSRDLEILAGILCATRNSGAGESA
jgi:hypothetical protein